MNTRILASSQADGWNSAMKTGLWERIPYTTYTETACIGLW